MTEAVNDVVQGTGKDTNGTLSGTISQTLTDKGEYSTPQSAPPENLACFKGPEVNGSPTTVTLFTPSQLIGSPLIPSLFKMINNAYRSAHEKSGFNDSVADRFQNEDDILQQLGDGPGTFIYVIQYVGTKEVVGTIAARRYFGTQSVDLDDPAATTRGLRWHRQGPIPADTEGWELKQMAVEPKSQGQGLASYLTKLVDDQIRRRFKMSLSDTMNGGSERPNRLIMVLSTLKEINEPMYTKMGYVIDYDVRQGKGFDGGEQEFHVVHMSRFIAVDG